MSPPPLIPLLLLVGLLVLSRSAATEDLSLPEPLSLDQALRLAGDDPGVSEPTGPAIALPYRDSLYLDCHGLAFANAVADPGRGRPAAALLDPPDGQRLEVLTRYLDVLLADLAYARFNEAMAVAYVQWDRAANRRDLGQVSDLRVMELEMAYAGILQSRTGSELAQQLTRSLLASALGHPETLPRDLVEPRLPRIPDPLPETDAALAAAERDNAMVGRLLRDGGEVESQRVLLALRRQLVELGLRLRALDAAARQVATESAYRDLKLDESRTLYEQEVTADLGYSMSRQTMTRLRERRIAFCRAITWAELAALMGRSDLGGLARASD